MTDPLGWSIVPVPVPASLDAPDAWLLHGTAAVDVAVQLDIFGVADDAWPARQVLGVLRDATYVRRLVLAAVAGPSEAAPDPARVLGTAMVKLPQEHNTHSATVLVAVAPEHRGHGIGTALLDAALDLARSEGRSVVMTSTDHRTEPDEGPGALVPATGTGRLPVDDAGAGFAQHRGWHLEQVARRSVLDLPFDAARIDELHASAAEAAGPDYRLVSWTDRCPDEWADELAVLETRMSTDTPMGELDLGEDVWDAARVRDHEAAQAERGVTERVVAVEHVPTRTLAGFTALISSEETPEVAHQADTLVRAEHRGHRLGMLVKIANLRRLAAERPGTRRVATWNAQENDYMLAINVALGFHPAGVSGEWQRRLDARD